MWIVALVTFARTIQILEIFACLIIHHPNAQKWVLAAKMITNVVVMIRDAGERRTTGIHDCAWKDCAKHQDKLVQLTVVAQGWPVVRMGLIMGCQGAKLDKREQTRQTRLMNKRYTETTVLTFYHINPEKKYNCKNTSSNTQKHNYHSKHKQTISPPLYIP